MLGTYLLINDFTIYRPSGSFTSDGSYVETGSIYLTGKGRLDPVVDDEGDFTYNFFCNVIDVDEGDSIVIDGVSFNVKSVLNYFNDHLELKLNSI